MAPETTTIEITTEQKRALDDLKHGDKESYKGVLQRLIDSHSQERDGVTEARVRELAREEINDRVVREAMK